MPGGPTGDLLRRVSKSRYTWPLLLGVAAIIWLAFSLLLWIGFIRWAAP